MRIALLASSYPRFKGDITAPFIQSISEHLAAIGHEVVVIAPFDAAVRPNPDQKVSVHRFRYIWPDNLHIMGHARALEADIRLKPISYILLPAFLLASFASLYRICKSKNIEVIYAHWVLPNGPVAAMVARLLHIPFVVNLHGSDIYVSEMNPIFGFISRWVFKHAAHVISCSSTLRDRAIKLGAPLSTSLIAWGTDPLRFAPQQRSHPYRQELGLAPDDFCLITLGRLVYKKGFNILLDSLPEVFRDCPKVKLVIGGDGPIRGELEEQAKNLSIKDRVIFAGMVPWDQTPTFLASGDLFLLPSIQDKKGNVDGLPTVLIEAMGCELPIIASDISGIRLAIEDQVNGVLVSPGDSIELKRTIIRLIKDEPFRNRIAVESRRTVVSRLNWNQVAISIASILQACIKNH